MVGEIIAGIGIIAGIVLIICAKKYRLFANREITISTGNFETEEINSNSKKQSNIRGHSGTADKVCNFCAIDIGAEIAILADDRRKKFERELGWEARMKPYLTDSEGRPEWSVCSMCAGVVASNIQKRRDGEKEMGIFEDKKAESRFVDNGDGTITDNKTNLMWQKEDDGQTRTFKESEAYCKRLTLGGYRDWRLPNIDELRSVSDDWEQIFANPKNDEPYWSNTVFKNPSWEPVSGEKAKYVVMVLFSNGDENNYFLFYKYNTRAVRQTP